MAKKTNCEINGVKYYRKYVTINGKRKMVYAESEKKWREKVDELKAEETLGIIDTRKTLGDAIEIYIYYTLPETRKLRLSTYSIHEGVYRNQIKGRKCMGISLKDIKSTHMQSLVNEMEDEGRTPNSIQMSMRILKGFFKYAVAEGYLHKNPTVNVSQPKIESSGEIKVYTSGEIERLNEILKNERYGFMFRLALATGIRAGEMLALEPADFNLEDKLLSITKQQKTERIIVPGEKIKYEVVDDVPKTENSVRVLPLNDIIIKEYKDYLRFRQEQKLKFGEGKLQPKDKLFVTVNNFRWQSSQLQKLWLEIQLKAEVEYKNIHCLRHTYITKLMQAPETKAVTVMELAGHSKMETTLKYTHVEYEYKKIAAESIAELL